MSSTKLTHRLEHPSCLFVSTCLHEQPCPEKEREEDGRGVILSLDLPFFPRRTLGLPTRQGRVFSLKRRANEDAASCLLRLTSNVNKHFDKPHSDDLARLRVVGARFMPSDNSQPTLRTVLLQHGSQSPDSAPLNLCLDLEVVGLPGGGTPVACEVVYEVRLEPASVERAKLELLPFVGCPVCPAVKLGKTCDLSKSTFQWFVSKNTPAKMQDAEWSIVPTSEGYIFTPQPEHSGRYIRLRVLPFDSMGTPGLPFGDLEPSHEIGTHLFFFGQFINCAKAVTHAPAQEIQHKRFRETVKPADGGDSVTVDAFRLVCYNILAYMYSTTNSASEIFFPQCPLPYLEPDYRFPLIHREILAYNGDIVCLQEVDESHFEHRLKFLMERACGFEGHYLTKLSIEVPENTNKYAPPAPIENYNRKGEGVAIFFRRDRFRLVAKFEVDSLIIKAETDFPELGNQYRQLHESGEVAVYNCLRSRAHGVLVCVLESQRSAKRLLVATTHLYFHPDAMPLRDIQCQVLRRVLLDLAVENSIEVASDGKIRPLPIILAADLNTTPDCPNYVKLVGGPSDITANGTCDHAKSPVLHSAVNLPHGTFSNMVPNFKANLDAILYTGSLAVRRKFALPTEAEVLEAGRRSLDDGGAGILKPRLLPNNGGHTLPSSQFPSDHLALLSDFELVS